MIERLPKTDGNSERFSLETITNNNLLILNARRLAERAHDGQKRNDGSPYFTHCEEVARIVCEELQINDPVMIAAAYLHDVSEDTNITLEYIQMDFGEDVANIVDGVTKIRQEIKENGERFTKAERDKLSETKVIQESVIDPRVGILKAAADRLHNMRTLQFMPEEKRPTKAYETLIYAKLLESLGVWTKMIELEDLAFKYIDPKSFNKFKKITETDERFDPLFVENIVSGLQSLIPGGIEAEISHKGNGLLRLMHKMEKTPDIKDVNDLISFRIAIDEENDELAANQCYQILKALQEKYAYQEDQDRFDNFYFKPRSNGYSAIQMTINTPKGAIEIAITSKKKEDFNNWGVINLIRKGEINLSEYSRVLVFTPKGDVRFFPKGATAIDFAYSIDPNLGVRAISAEIDGAKKEMTSVLLPGQTVLINIGDERIAPDHKWLDSNYCLPETLEKINEQILNEKRYEQIQKGKEQIEKIIRKRGLVDLIDLFSFDQYHKPLVNMLFYLGCKGSLDNLYFQIGDGHILPEKLDEQLNIFGLSGNKMGLRTVVINGKDKSGILEFVASNLKTFRGNVGALNLDRQSSNETVEFSLRLVVEGLTKRSGKQLKDSLLKGDCIKNVTIV